MEKQKNNNDDWLKTYAKFSGIAFQMLAIIGGGTWGGYKLDESSSREFPLFTVLFSLIAIGIALYIVIKQAISK